GSRDLCGDRSVPRGERAAVLAGGERLRHARAQLRPQARLVPLRSARRVDAVPRRGGHAQPVRRGLQPLRPAFLERNRVHRYRQPLLPAGAHLLGGEGAGHADALLPAASHPAGDPLGGRRAMSPARPLAMLALAVLALATTLAALVPGVGADVPVPVPPDQRGRLDAERSGFHDAANIRTVFWNFGMV